MHPSPYSRPFPWKESRPQGDWPARHDYPGERPRYYDRRQDGRNGKYRFHDENYREDSKKSEERKRKRADSEIPWWDDKDRHYIVRPSEDLTPRYKIMKEIGEGTFGKVVEAWDRKEKEYVAIKIVRAIEKYREAALIEIDILEQIARKDLLHSKPLIHMYSWFDFRDHICMVFPKYGLSLYDFLKKNHYKPFNMAQIQSFAHQILEAVAFMHKMELIHTDLKPENILLINSEYTTRPWSSSSSIRVPLSDRIKVIDFGSATFEYQHHTAIVSTRHYRAPEGIGWSYPCDIWSVGTLLIELFTGDAVFQTHENHEHLKLMECTFGPIPRDLVRRIQGSGRKYFDQNLRLIWPGKAKPSSIEHVQRQTSLTELIRPQDEIEYEFLSLIRHLLEYQPEDRWTAEEALRHPFFKINAEKYAYQWQECKK